MMQYCYEKLQLKCLFGLCCEFSEYQSENFLLNLILLIILLLIGTGLCAYMYYTKDKVHIENSLENNRNGVINNNNTVNNANQSMNNLSLFEKKLNMTQMNFLRENRAYLADRNSGFTHTSNIIIMFFNVFIAFLFLAKFFEMLNLNNEFNFNASLFSGGDNFSTDKGLLIDDYLIPKKIVNFTIQVFGLIFAFAVFNLDSEFLDHNKKNIFTILFFAYFFYDSINIYSAKKILLYENYLFYSVVSLVLIITIFVYSIYINKIFFSKLSKKTYQFIFFL